jgi:hypothetical protein
MYFLNHREGVVFLFAPLQCSVTQYRNCKRLRDFEEI